MYDWEGPTLAEAFDLIIDNPTVLGNEELLACVKDAENADTVIIRMGEHIGEYLAREDD